MAKFTKFSIDSNGDLVYRSNGNLARNVTNINPRTRQAGNTVYSTKTGRKVGNVGKATAKEQRTIDKKAKRRLREREKVAQRETIEYARNLTEKGEWESIAFTKKLNDAFRDQPHEYNAFGEKYFIDIESQRAQNFASTLNRMVDSNVISIDDANEYWDAYKNGDKDIRSELWREIDGLADEYGLPPSDPITIF